MAIKGTFTVSREVTFSAAHAVRGHRGGCENLHGHNWRARVTVAANELDALSMVIDFKVLKQALNEIVEALDHRFLNDVAPFDALNPTSENMAAYIFEQCSQKLDDQRVRVRRVEVWESDRNKASFEANEAS